jgi:sugar lactone lactonase YvrE
VKRLPYLALALLALILGLATTGLTQGQYPSQPEVRIAAGNAEIGEGLPATDAFIGGIGSLALNSEGDVYFTDIGNSRIRRVDGESGIISTIAGTELVDTSLLSPNSFFSPGPIVADETNHSLVVAEVVSKRVRRIDLKTLKVTDLGAPAQGFGQPVGLLYRAPFLYVVDTLYSQIWQLDGEDWKPLFRQKSPATGGLRQVVIDDRGDFYVSEFFGHRIWRWNHESGDFSIVAGSGKPGRAPSGSRAADSAIATPDGLAVHGSYLYFAEMTNARVSRIDLKNGTLEVYRDGSIGRKQAWRPSALALDRAGNLYLSDVLHNRILRFAPDSIDFSVVAGNGGDGDGGPAIRANLAHPGRLTVDPKGDLYIADAMHHRIRKVDATTGLISTVAGTGQPGYNGDSIPGTSAELAYPGGVLADSSGHLYIGDYYNNRVRMLDLTNGIIYTVAGNGQGGETGDGGPSVEARLLNPHALTFDPNGNLLVTSAVTSSVRRINLKTGTIDSIALDPQVVPPNETVIFYGIAGSKQGFYLADGMRSSILYHSEGKTAAQIPSGRLTYPMDVALAPDGTLYICDTRANRVVRWNGTELETVLEGLARPRGLAFDRRGHLYVADTFNNRVLEVKLEARK